MLISWYVKSCKKNPWHEVPPFLAVQLYMCVWCWQLNWGVAGWAWPPVQNLFPLLSDLLMGLRCVLGSTVPIFSGKRCLICSDNMNWPMRVLPACWCCPTICLSVSSSTFSRDQIICPVSAAPWSTPGLVWHSLLKDRVRIEVEQANLRTQIHVTRAYADCSEDLSSV